MEDNPILRLIGAQSAELHRSAAPNDSSRGHLRTLFLGIHTDSRFLIRVIPRSITPRSCAA